MVSELTAYLWETLNQPEKLALAERPEPLLSLRSRRETLARFRDQWAGQGDWRPAFMAWLPTDQAGDRGEGEDQVLIGTQIARAVHALGGDKFAAAYTKKNGEGLRLRQERTRTQPAGQKTPKNH